MKDLSAAHQSQIEDLLQRALSADELTAAPSLQELSTPVLAVARILAAKQIVLGVIYLRAVTPATLPEAKVFLDEIG